MAGFTQAQLDHAARQQGFSNYAQYQAYQAHRRMILQNPNVGQPAAPQQQPVQPAQQPPQNWLQRLMWGLSGGGKY